MRAIEEGDFDQLTIRSLSADLGVAPMSLYRHVRGKDDLLIEVADRLLEGAWRPTATTDDWRLWVAEAAERFRRLLVRQPAVLHVYLSRPVVSPASLERMQAILAVLGGAGFDAASASRAYAAVQTYTIGFAALESSRERGQPGVSDDEEDAVAARLAAFSTPRQFSDGLDYLLEGIEHARRARRRRAAPDAFRHRTDGRDRGAGPRRRTSSPEEQS